MGTRIQSANFFPARKLPGTSVSRPRRGCEAAGRRECGALRRHGANWQHGRCRQATTGILRKSSRAMLNLFHVAAYAARRERKQIWHTRCIPERSNLLLPEIHPPCRTFPAGRLRFFSSASWRRRSPPPTFPAAQPSPAARNLRRIAGCFADRTTPTIRQSPFMAAAIPRPGRRSIRDRKVNMFAAATAALTA